MLAGANLAERGFDAFEDVELGIMPAARPGVLLQRARAAIGASIADVARHTRITQRQLESIEQGRYGTFHGRIYAIGFARSYARFVGLAEQPIVAAVREEYDAARPGHPVHHRA